MVVKVDKAKFDALLGKMLSMPPMPNAELKIGKRKRRARKPRA